MRNRTLDLWIPRSDALPLSHRDYGERGLLRSSLLYFFTELKTCYLSYSIYKHDAIDIADPSNTQDAYHINFVINLAHCRVYGSVSGHRSAESDCEGLRFDSSWRPRIFSLFHARETSFFISLPSSKLVISLILSIKQWVLLSSFPYSVLDLLVERTCTVISVC